MINIDTYMQVQKVSGPPLFMPGFCLFRLLPLNQTVSIGS